MPAWSSRPISPLAAWGSRKAPLIPLDDALAAGRLQAAAELGGFVRGPERTNHGAVVDALLAQIGALDDGAARSQNRRELALQGPERGLGVGFVPLRGDLDEVAATTGGHGLRRVCGSDPGTGFRRGGRLRSLRRQR